MADNTSSTAANKETTADNLLQLPSDVLRKVAAFTFAADAICDKPDSDMIKDAWVWAKERNAYGLRAWSVNPHLGGGEWKQECNDAAPGLQAMCASADAGCKAP